MKLNKYLLMAAMGLGLIACTENDLVEGGDSNGTQNEGTTYVGFSLKFNASNTRATTTEDGTAAEQKINSAYVVMANASGVIEAVVSTTEAGTAQNVNKDCYVFQTTPGVHYFYAVVNPDVSGNVTTSLVAGKNIDDYFNTGTALTVSEIASATDADNGSFMMASHEVLTASVEDGVTKDEALAGSANSYTINVERASAKVTMTCENTTLTNATNNADGTITTPKFTLKGGAGKSYRMAQYPFTEIAENTWPYSSSATDVYVKQETDADNIHRSADPVYCLENIHTTGYKQGNTTYLTLQTTFTPAKVVNCADEIKELKDNTTTGTFYVVKQGELAGNYIMETDLTTYQNGDDSKLPAGVEAISDAYTNGTCYFGPIWIGQEEADAANAPVVRNTWYNLKITGITLPGDPKEPTIDPEQPLTPATNVAITLSVMPWNFIDREINLQ